MREQTDYINPAELLAGEDLGNGWVVTDRVARDPNLSGGCFSVSYTALSSETGEVAFLKALNFRPAVNAQDRLRVLQSLISAFIHERDLLLKCGGHKMRRVVTPILDGVHEVHAATPPFNEAYYLIFPLADSDLRSRAVELMSLDLAWALRSLHHVATGIHELHVHGIVHQDVKPSNILYFDKHGSKLADLGRAHDPENPAEHDVLARPGDYTHDPLELRYTSAPPASTDVRKSIDLYCLGSLLFFHFLGYSASQGILARARRASAPLTFHDLEHDLPYLITAFGELAEELERSVREYTDDLVPSIMGLATELCHPDPSQRGNPKLRRIGAKARASAERYVSKLNSVARRAELGML